MATIFVLLKVLLKNVTVIIYCSFSTLQLGSANKSVEFVFSPSSDVKNRGKKTSHFFWSGKPLLNPTLYYFFNCSVKMLNQQSICGTWIDAGAFFFFSICLWWWLLSVLVLSLDIGALYFCPCAWFCCEPLSFPSLILQAASSLACARRGWVNLDVDKIECESCGANLQFVLSASWTPTEGGFCKFSLLLWAINLLACIFHFFGHQV